MAPKVSDKIQTIHELLDKAYALRVYNLKPEIKPEQLWIMSKHDCQPWSLNKAKGIGRVANNEIGNKNTDNSGARIKLQKRPVIENDPSGIINRIWTNKFCRKKIKDWCIHRCQSFVLNLILAIQIEGRHKAIATSQDKKNEKLWIHSGKTIRHKAPLMMVDLLLLKCSWKSVENCRNNHKNKARTMGGWNPVQRL